MKYLLCLPSVLLGLLLTVSANALPPLQLYVELTEEGGILRPPAGHYSGPVVINRQITIEGRGEVIVDGEGSDTVVTLKANGSTIRGLQIIGSGGSFDKVDAGILVEADHSLIENNKIEDVLFGVHLRGENSNIIRGNHISSKSVKPSMRGEGLRLWNSYDNIIEDNDIVGVRDNFITNSSDNRLQGNRISNSRIGIQLVFAHENEIINNSIDNNGTGILLFYSNDLLIKQNKISHLRSFSGAAWLQGACGAVLRRAVWLFGRWLVLAMLERAFIGPPQIGARCWIFWALGKVALCSI